MKLTLLERFEGKILRLPEAGCWLWTGSVDRCGYGRILINGRNNTAHTIAWKLYRTGIPAGLCVCHHCDVPCCVNPTHLFLGTMADNIQDMTRKGRHGAWSKPERIARGEQQGRAKLNAVQILAIRNDQRSQYEIAAAYNVSQAHVSRLKAKQNWKHL